MNLSFDQDANFNTFETTIRVLGGLLLAYKLTGHDKLYLDRAIELADRMLPVFDTESRLPLPNVNLAQQKGVPDPDLPFLVSTAEVSTLQLEFRYLSYLMEEETYWEKVEAVMKTIKEHRMPHGLALIYLCAQTGQFVPSAIRLGPRGDSYYEYLLKQYIQTVSLCTTTATNAVHGNLISKSPYSRMTYTSELIPERHGDGQLSWRLTPKQDHLVCFFGGSLMLGATITGAADWKTGVELVRSCVDTHDTKTLSPEIVNFRIPSDASVMDTFLALRPETVESLFLAFRLTGDIRYRDWGWDIFQAIEKHCKVQTSGYASIMDEVPAQQEDKMETFLMSETLKYLFLLFKDASELPLDIDIFQHLQAHPLPIFTPQVVGWTAWSS
ncbi:seven-hairpin glycosidase [Gymnopus androsaceus JB14]|uniref:alpha-1,2-Mannosidase n=1 Tax=Gymnopus androsaceus JB14 TaxID=1447944 RepID=A0A6A4GWW0_9AGAR|nr:seven-hairpin glycosidase [Gymnopus androsaceus JB14]